MHTLLRVGSGQTNLPDRPEAPTSDFSSGVIPEIYGKEAGRLVPPDDAPALADAMWSVTNRPQTSREFAEKLSASIRGEFSIETMAAAIQAVYLSATVR